MRTRTYTRVGGRARMRKRLMAVAVPRVSVSATGVYVTRFTRGAAKLANAVWLISYCFLQYVMIELLLLLNNRSNMISTRERIPSCLLTLRLVSMVCWIENAFSQFTFLFYLVIEYVA